MNYKFDPAAQGIYKTEPSIDSNKSSEISLQKIKISETLGMHNPVSITEQINATILQKIKYINDQVTLLSEKIEPICDTSDSMIEESFIPLRESHQKKSSLRSRINAIEEELSHLSSKISQLTRRVDTL